MLVQRLDTFASRSTPTARRPRTFGGVLHNVKVGILTQIFISKGCKAAKLSVSMIVQIQVRAQAWPAPIHYLEQILASDMDRSALIGITCPVRLPG